MRMCCPRCQRTVVVIELPAGGGIMLKCPSCDGFLGDVMRGTDLPALLGSLDDILKRGTRNPFCT
jgi:hypothetical protein